MDAQENPVDQTGTVVRLAGELLGADHVIGMYRHGSALLGGLRPHSDIDVLVVVRERPSARVRRALVEALLPVSGPGSGPGAGALRPVELTVVAQGDVRPWRYPPVCAFQYGEWLRGSYERGATPGPEPSPDLAVLLTMVLQGNSPLVGPPPAEVLDAPTAGDVRRALLDSVPELLAELRSDTRNVLLTLARIWCTLHTGTITSKEAAADWALPRLPREHRPALAHARAVYRGDVEECWDEDGVGGEGRAGACGAWLAGAVRGLPSPPPRPFP
ncbi:aminoglycoside adenylyltransferase family protein [Streptomyces sp. Da 82-17]|uniref:aminoglycoside adenylyltransferase family protein n=1 Tax=Streptomyces sp. Da 82-17 TaxID=3377116 RepID=UPI0038D35DEF